MIQRAPGEVYTALLLPLLKSMRLMLPCVRPCLEIESQFRAILCISMNSIQNPIHLDIRYLDIDAESLVLLSIRVHNLLLA